MIGAKGKPSGPILRLGVATVYAVGRIRIIRPGVDNNRMKIPVPRRDMPRQELRAV